MAGLYIHVPFCKTRCAYCSFYSTTHQNLMDGYLSALMREMMTHKKGQTIETIYLGGGTPSQLGEGRLARILTSIHEHFSVASNAEITVEVNPDDVTAALASALVDNKVNRVSMGVQTFDDEELRLINRRHTSEQARQAVVTLREAGLQNISIDLIYGLPRQSMESFQRSIQEACSLPVTHISSYALSIEPGTLLYQQLEAGLIAETDETLMEEMYHALRKALLAAGYEHYEISNFCRPGYESRHNSSYWAGTPYIGLGPGAHSYDGHFTRRQNTSNLSAYIQAAEAPHTLEKLTPSEHYDELVFTRLRTARGLAIKDVPSDRQDYLLQMAAPHIAAERLSLTHGTLRVTPQALFISDSIFADLMAEE